MKKNGSCILMGKIPFVTFYNVCLACMSVAKISLVKDLKEIVQMDVLKDLMDISVNIQVNM
jgi:hypothetical protein